MVRKKRIGNDLVVRWRIKNKSTGEAYDLEGRNLTLTMTCSEMVINVDDYTIIGNTIEFSFLGRKQKYTGLYVLTLVEERGREGLLTLDTKEAFQLVPHSWQENEESDDGALGIETIDLVSEINGGVPGESAYKTACRHGFVGTEQEWLTSLEAKVTRPSIENALGYVPYERPESGIPSTDLAQGVIPDVSNFITKSVDDLTNYYLKEDTYTKAEVAALIRAIQQFRYEIAARTSDVTNPQSNVLYLIGPTGSGADKYEEYVYPDAVTGWVKIGDTALDLSGYVTTSALNTALESKVEKIAGKGLSTNDYNNVEKNKVSTAYNNRPWVRGQGDNSAALGEGNIASGARSVAEGSANLAGGDHSHVEGYSSQASGQGAHSEGQRTIAQGNYSHSEGIGGIHNAEVLFSGSGTSYTTAEEHEFTTGTILKFRDIVAKVISTPSDTSFITDIALSESPIVDSNDLYVVAGVAIGVAAHSEGTESIAQGEASHSEGYATKAKGVAAHAEGYDTNAKGNYSHTEGRSTKAKFAYCHSEGNGSITGASASHSEGYKSETGGTETSNTKKAGTLTTKGSYAHAEGNASLATGIASHTEGKKTFTQNEGEHAEGLFNKSNKASEAYGNAGNTQHSIGIGTSDDDRKNAIEVMQNGDIYIIGIGGYDGTNPSSASSLQDILRRM